MSKLMSFMIAWTYVCPTPTFRLDIRMSNLDTRTSNLSMLFHIIISNFLTSWSVKILKKNILKATFNLEFLAVFFLNSSISLDIHMSRLDIRMSIPTMLVLNNPQKLTFFKFFVPIKLNFWGQ